LEVNWCELSSSCPDYITPEKMPPVIICQMLGKSQRRSCTAQKKSLHPCREMT